MTRRVRIAVIPGDAIGQEVVAEGKRVLDALSGSEVAFEYEHFPWGCQYYLETGHMMYARASPIRSSRVWTRASLASGRSGRHARK